MSHKIFHAKVMHHRMHPKNNKFTYRVFYLLKNLDQLPSLQKLPILGVNRAGFMSFHEKDHGAKSNKTNTKKWAENIASTYGIKTGAYDIMLLSYPRVLGYVFNPVSFWFFIDKKNQTLHAILCEVNNTFGETHLYFCKNEDDSAIHSDQWMITEKIFHVSPFLERKGFYQFRFAWEKDKLGIWIDYYDKNHKKTLLTSLTGSFEDATKNKLFMCFIRYPLVTFKTIALIHYQALKLFIKRIKYLTKPEQKEPQITLSTNVKKS